MLGAGEVEVAKPQAGFTGLRGAVGGTDAVTLVKAPGQRKSALDKGVTNVLGERNEAAPPQPWGPAGLQEAGDWNSWGRG